jgi:hypothetical protein
MSFRQDKGLGARTAKGEDSMTITTVTAERIECPECRADKCGNCLGDAWDNDTDQPVVCWCYAWGHQRTNDVR